MKSLSRNLFLGSLAILFFFFFALGLARPALASNYGAVYTPSLAPDPPIFGTPESFLDGITPGKKYKVQVTVTNAGTIPWPAQNGSMPVHLSYHWTGPTADYEGVRTWLPQDVQPGQTINLEADLATPAVPGTYTLHWDLVHENVTWFSTAGVPTEDQIVGVGGRVGFDLGAAGEQLYESERCKYTDCTGGTDETGERSCLTPNISGASSKTVSQGSFFWVIGCGFQPQDEFHLVLVDTNQDFQIKVQGAFPGLIGGDVPANFGAEDQPAYVYVRRPGTQSNFYSLKFVSLKHTVLLPQDHVQVVKCSGEADDNHCNGVFSVDKNVCCVLDLEGLGNPISSFSTVTSYHYTDGSAFGDSGKDVYFVDLAPGWTLEKMVFQKVQLNGGGNAGPVSGFVQGANSSTITVPWSVGGNSGVAYYLDLYATGPINTKP